MTINSYSIYGRFPYLLLLYFFYKFHSFPKASNDHFYIIPTAWLNGHSLNTFPDVTSNDDHCSWVLLRNNCQWPFLFVVFQWTLCYWRMGSNSYAISKIRQIFLNFNYDLMTWKFVNHNRWQNVLFGVRLTR